jgi:prepilin-type N-terminal cleavage/methylation domain-containing protein
VELLGGNEAVKRRSNNGFTLIEVLVVMAIIGVLSAIALPHWQELAVKSHDAAAQSDYRNIKVGVFTALTDPSTPDRFVLRRVQGPRQLPAPLNDVNISDDVQVDVFHRTIRRNQRRPRTITTIDVYSLDGSQRYRYSEVNGAVTEQVIALR